MKGRQLLDAMAYIDDALIEEAAPLLEKEHPDAAVLEGKRRKWKRITELAAVFVVAVVALWVWNRGIISQERTVLEQEQNAGAYDSGDSVSGYALAENAPGIAPIAEQKEDNGVEEAAFSENLDAGGVMISGGIAADTESVREQDTEDGIDDLAQELKGNAIVRIIDEFHLSSEYCYKLPEKGNCIISIGLKTAIDYYDNEQNTIESEKPDSYLYHVTIDVFGEMDYDCDETDCDGVPSAMEELRFSEEGKEKLYQEYERMLSEEFNVSLSEDYQLTGTLSREEIEDFEPYPDYGYVFRLIKES